MKNGNLSEDSHCELKEESLRVLVEQAASGNLDSYHALYQVFSRRIFNFVLCLTKSREDAEDLTQDAFIQAFHNLKSLKKPERFEQWLYRIARNAAYQRFRRRKGEEIPLEVHDRFESSPVERVRGIGNPEDEFLQEELSVVVEKALATLPVKLREAFMLSVLQGKSYKEIAEIVGRSLLAVKTDIYRARIFAKDMIKRYLAEG